MITVGYSRSIISGASTTAINLYNAANDDIVAFDYYAPATSGPILISDQTATGFDAPSSGDTSIGFAYAGDIDPSTSKRVPVKLSQDEIHIEGARRVTGYDVGLAIGSHVGPNDSAGNPTGTICAPGVAYFVTKSDVDPDARIPDITGLTVREGATNRITNVDGSVLFGADDTTITTGLSWSGIDGFSMESNANNSRHVVFRTVSGVNNPHRTGRGLIIKPESGTDFFQISTSLAYANFQFSTNSVTQTANAQAEIKNLGDGYYYIKFRNTIDINSTSNFTDFALITSATAPLQEVHTTAGLKVSIFGYTNATNNGGSNVPYPGIINNTTGSTLARLDEAPDSGTTITLPLTFAFEVDCNSSVPQGALLGANGTALPVEITSGGNIRVTDDAGTTVVTTGALTSGGVRWVAVAIEASEVRIVIDGGSVETLTPGSSLVFSAVTERNLNHDQQSQYIEAALLSFAELGISVPNAGLLELGA